MFRKRGAGEGLKTFSNTVFKQHFGKKDLKSILTGKVRKQFQTRAFKHCLTRLMAGLHTLRIWSTSFRLVVT